MKGWQNIFHESRNQKEVGVAITISDKLDFKPKTVIKNKGDLYNKTVNLSRRYNNHEYICTQHQNA